MNLTVELSEMVVSEKEAGPGRNKALGIAKKRVRKDGKDGFETVVMRTPSPVGGGAITKRARRSGAQSGIFPAIMEQGQYQDVASKAREFWRSCAARNVAAADLPLDRPRTASNGGHAAECSTDLSAALCGRLTEFSRQNHQTSETVVMAAFEALLSRYTGQTEFLLARHKVGRSTTRGGAAAQDSQGRFTEQWAVFADLSGDPTFARLLQRVRSCNTDWSRQRTLPLPEIQKQLQYGRGGSAASGRLRVAFSCQANASLASRAGHAVTEPLLARVLQVIPRPPLTGPTEFDLTLTLMDEGEERTGKRLKKQLQEPQIPADLKTMRLHLAYNSDLLSPALMAQLLELLRRTVDAVIADPESRLSELPLLSAAEQAALENEANGRTLETDLFRPYLLIELLEGHAERRPAEAAIVAGGRELTWENLHKRSREYAAVLKTRGVRKGSVVAVRMESRTETVICCVALLKLGAIVVPVPGSADSHGWESVWKRVCPELAITAKGFLRASWTTWNYEALAASYIRPGDFDRIEPQDIACMVLTSTGDQSIGTHAVDHQTAVRTARGAARRIRLAEGDLLQILPAVGSLEAWSDLMMGLCAGACTILYAGVDDVRSDLAALRSRRRYLAGSFAEVIAAHSSAPQAIAETVLCRDGRLGKTQYKALRARGIHGFTLLYAVMAGGPVAISGIGMETGEQKLAPIAGFRFRLRDAFGRCPPRGSENEMVLSVLNHRFATDTIKRVDGTESASLLRSGWICRLEAEGGLQVVDTAERRSTLDGSRLRLRELEDALLAQEAVAEAVAIVQLDQHHRPSLHAYLIAGHGGGQKLESIREALRRSLPENLAAAELHWVPAYPRRLDGTVDGARVALSILSELPPVEDQAEPSTEPNEAKVEVLMPALHSAPAAEVRIPGAFRFDQELLIDEGRLIAKELLITQELRIAQELGITQEPRTAQELRITDGSPAPGATAVSRCSAMPRADAIEATVAETWESVLGVRAISSNTNFFELGSYRPMLPRLFSRINDVLGTQMHPDVIYNAPTIAELANIARGETCLPTLVPIQPEGIRPPLFVIHSSAIYDSLAQVVGADHPMYGLRALKEDCFDSIEARAAHYASIISRAYGPYHLAGCGDAGPLVAETARQLRRMGEEVGEVILFESSLNDHWEPSSSEGDVRSQHKESLPSQPLAANQLSDTFFSSPQRQQVSYSTGATLHLNPQQFDGKITLIRNSGSRHGAGDSLACGWENVARGGVDVHWVRGDSDSMFTAVGWKGVGRVVNSRLSRAQ